MTSVNVTTTKNTVTVNGETRVVTVKTAGPQGAQGVLQTGDLGDITVTTTGSGTQTVAINTGVVTSSKILDGTIATGDIADDAITSAKIANAAVTTNEIQNLTIINNDISNSAAIDGSKISPDFGSQNIVTTGQFHSTGSGTSSGLKISNAYDSVFQFFVNNNDNSDFYISYGNSGGPEIKLGHDGKVSLSHAGTTRIQTTTVGASIIGNLGITGTVDGVDIAARDTLFGGLTSSSGVLTDGVTGTTQSATDDSTKIATTAFVKTAVSNLVDSAPNTLDTLNELAAALDDDPNFATTVTNLIGDRLAKTGGTLTGDLTISTTAPLIKFDESVTNKNYFLVLDDSNLSIRKDSTAGSNIVQRWNSDGHIDFLTNVDFASGIDVTGQIVSESTTGTGSTGLKIANSNESFVQYFEGGGADATFVMSYTGSGGTDIRFKHNGEIQLNFGGQEKFKTTSTGVDVTGNIEVSGSGTFDSGLTVKDASGSDPSMQINHSDADVTGEFLRIGRTDLATRYHSLKAQHGGAATANLLSFHLHDGGSSPFTGQHEVLKLQGNKQVTVAGNLDVGEGVDITGGVTWSAQSNVTGTIDFAADTLATYTPSKTGTGSDTATDAAISLRRGHKIVSQHDGFIRNVLVHHTSHDIHIGQNNTGIVRHIDLLPGSTGSVRLFFDGATNTTPKLTTSANGVDVTGNTTTTQFFGAGTTSPATNFHSFANNTHIGHQIRIEQDGAGDAVLGWELTGTRAWSAGIDNSDSNRWKLSSGSSVDSNTQITIEQDGFVGLHHDSGTNPKLKTTSYGITVNDGDSGFTGTYNARVAAVVEGSNSGGTVLNIMSPASGFSGIFFGQPSSAARGQIQYQHNAVSGGTPAETFRFITAGGTETMLMNSTSIDLKEPVNVTGAITSTVSAANTDILALKANMGTNNNRTLTFKAPATDSGVSPFTIVTGNSLEFEVDNARTLFINDDGQVNLHHDGSTFAKLSTSATGVDVNGVLDVEGSGFSTSPSIFVNTTSTGSFIHAMHLLSPNIQSTQSNILVLGKSKNQKNSAFLGYKYSSDNSNDNLFTINMWGPYELLTINGQGNTTIAGDVVAIGDGTFDDIRVGEWAGNSTFAGVLHKNHSGSEYMMISNGSSTSGDTYISATTGRSVFIRGGNNSQTNQIQVSPTGGINLTAANNINILDGNISFENSSDIHPYIRMKGNTGSTARVKYAVWNSQTYGMGMTSGMSYGSIGNQIAEGVEFAMTFQMNNSNSRGWIFLDASHTNAQGAMSLTTQGRMTVAHSMRLGYGESDTTESGATHALDVSGSIASTSTITCTSLTETSDIALKENIQPLSNVLHKVKQLTGYKYNFKNKEKASMGVIAQDVEKVFPELVHGEEGEKSLQYSGLVGALVEAIKELSAKVAVLESK